MSQPGKVSAGVTHGPFSIDVSSGFPMGHQALLSMFSMDDIETIRCCQRTDKQTVGRKHPGLSRGKSRYYPGHRGLVPWPRRRWEF
jgi:hypothetical protein